MELKVENSLLRNLQQVRTIFGKFLVKIPELCFLPIESFWRGEENSKFTKTNPRWCSISLAAPVVFHATETKRSGKKRKYYLRKSVIKQILPCKIGDQKIKLITEVVNAEIPYWVPNFLEKAIVKLDFGQRRAVRVFFIMKWRCSE